MNNVMNSLRYGLLIMSAFLLLSNFCYGETNNRKDYGLKGSVCALAVKDIEFKIKFGEVVPTGKSNDTLFFFLKNGNMYAEVLTPRTPRKYRRFEYDEHNNLTEEMLVSVGKGREYRIDDKLYHLNDTTEHKIYQYAYDPENRLKEIKFFKLEKWLDDMKQYYRIVYSYDSSGKKIVYRNEYSVEKEVIYNGSIRKTKDYHFSRNDPTVITETLSTTGKPIKKEISSPPFYFERSTISYNKFGDEVKILRQLGNDGRSEETIQYVYDQNGNWLKRLHYVGDELKAWTEREITYAVSDEDYSKAFEGIMMLEAGGKTIQSFQKAWEEEEKSVATDIDENAQFPGGDEHLSKWIYGNLIYPSKAKENGIQGKVFIRFIVECDGSISFARVLRSPSEDLNSEALRLVKSMPKWIPAMKDGQPVRESRIISIMFRLN